MSFHAIRHKHQFVALSIILPSSVLKLDVSVLLQKLLHFFPGQEWWFLRESAEVIFGVWMLFLLQSLSAIKEASTQPSSSAAAREMKVLLLFYAHSVDERHFKCQSVEVCNDPVNIQQDFTSCAYFQVLKS